jgi:hypothetical protein
LHDPQGARGEWSAKTPAYRKEAVEMLETTTPELATYCGLYCGACAMKNGQIRDTATRLKRLLTAYKYPEWAPQVAQFFPATEHYPEFDAVLDWLTTQDCPACKGGGGPPQCAIRICAKEKALAGCWECPEDGCDKLQGIDQATPMAPENRQHIREAGLKAWLEEQAAKVAGGFSYYDEYR